MPIEKGRNGHTVVRLGRGDVNMSPDCTPLPEEGGNWKVFMLSDASLDRGESTHVHNEKEIVFDFTTARSVNLLIEALQEHRDWKFPPCESPQGETN